MTPRVGGATITRVVARAIAAWAGARAVTLRGGAGIRPRAMLIAGPGTGGPRSARAWAHCARDWAHRARAGSRGIRAGPGFVGLDPCFAVADRAPGGFGRVLFGFLLGAPRP